MKNIKLGVIIFITVFLCINILLCVNHGFSEESDPLVSQSYVEMRIEQVKAYFEDKISSLNSDIDSLKASTPGNQGNVITPVSFVPIVVKPGQKLIGGAGTEMILRSGTCKTITSQQGGITDVTGGLDIQGGKEVPKQHLLIIPRDDGRGLNITSSYDAIILVKGTYKIQ